MMKNDVRTHDQSFGGLLERKILQIVICELELGTYVSISDIVVDTGAQKLEQTRSRGLTRS